MALCVHEHGERKGANDEREHDQDDHRREAAAGGPRDTTRTTPASTEPEKCLLIPGIAIGSSERPTVPARRDGLQIIWGILDKDPRSTGCF